MTPLLKSFDLLGFRCQTGVLNWIPQHRELFELLKKNPCKLMLNQGFGTEFTFSLDL